MVRMQADKTISCGCGGGLLVVLEVGVDQLQLRLLRVAPEGVARFKFLKFFDCQQPVTGIDGADRLFVKLIFRNIGFHALTAKNATAGQQADNNKGGEQFG